MSLAQYCRFLFVGGFVALITVGTREVLGYLFHRDTVIAYSASVGAAYVIGILLSYLLNHRFTFGGGDRDRAWRGFPLFIAVACTGLVATWLLSIGIRYGIDLDKYAGRYAGALAFATAAVLASLITYPLNARFVFRQRPG
jgi:putative flippase GtrA